MSLLKGHCLHKGCTCKCQCKKSTIRSRSISLLLYISSGYVHKIHSMSRVFQKYCNGLPNPMLISTVHNLNKLIFPSFFKLFNTNSTLKSSRSIFPIIFCYDSILICLWAHIPPIPLDFMIRVRLLWSVVIANFELQSGWCQ